MRVCSCLFEGYGYHRDLHVLTHSVPTRRSADLPPCVTGGATRRQSAKAGLEYIAATGGAGNVLIHGAARPFLPHAVIYRLLDALRRSEEQTSELQSLMSSSYAVFCLTHTNCNSSIITILTYFQI